MTLLNQTYSEQCRRWPASGRHILAQFGENHVVVYQAYGRRIGEYAIEHQRFGGDYRLTRMSWIKPNFLWMMHRCGWATKVGQEMVLAVHLRREAFDQILGLAVHSGYIPEVYGSMECWKARLAESPVRLQWDPDHDPAGAKLDRRAIQLGLSGDVLRCYTHEWIVKIEDISNFVAKQRSCFINQGSSGLVTPREEVYPVRTLDVARRLGIDHI
jgi:Domain of unknown function (DUF4291)